MDSQSEHYEGLHSPDVIQSKKTGKKKERNAESDFLSLRDAAFPLISENTQPALSLI